MGKIAGIEVVEAEEQTEGRGAKVLRAFPSADFSHLDPFVLLDEFFVDPSAGFPLHAHRGFEAVTYMLDGAFEHEDTSGNKAIVENGGLQRITMGAGIKHSEKPSSNETTHGLQLWVNLPQELKNVEPSYEVVPKGELKTEHGHGLKQKILINSTTGPTLQTEVEYVDVLLEGAEWYWRPDRAKNGLLYILKGTGRLSAGSGEVELKKGRAAIKQGKAGLEAKVKTDDTLHFVALVGAPHHEPINQRGSFVD